jgi:hypothetical protein
MSGRKIIDVAGTAAAVVLGLGLAVEVGWHLFGPGTRGGKVLWERHELKARLGQATADEVSRLLGDPTDRVMVRDPVFPHSGVWFYEPGRTHDPETDTTDPVLVVHFVNGRVQGVDCHPAETRPWQPRPRGDNEPEPARPGVPDGPARPRTERDEGPVQGQGPL